MKALLKKIDVYLITVLGFAALTGFALNHYGKIQLQLLVNQTHTPFQDAFFKLATSVGNGWTVSVAVLAVALYHFGDVKRMFSVWLLGMFSLLSCGILAQFLKRVVFPHARRPISVIGRESLYLVTGVEVQHAYSFPSGHATVAFAFFSFLAFLLHRKKYLQLPMALCAALVAYSRVYLSQHFTGDILAGTLLGIAGFFIAYLILDRWLERSKSLGSYAPRHL